MSTLLEIRSNIKAQQQKINRLCRLLRNAEAVLLSEEQRYYDALNARRLAEQGAAAVEAAQAVVGRMSE